MAATAKLRHNHDPLPFNAYVDQGLCQRCDANRAAKLADGETPSLFNLAAEAGERAWCGIRGQSL